MLELEGKISCEVPADRRDDARIESLVEPIAPALEKIVAGSLRRSLAPHAALLAWPMACGSVVAERTCALEFCRGVLKVEVPDAAWRNELQHLAPKYLATVSRYVSGVSRIEFVLRSAPAAQTQRSEVRPQK